MSETRIEHLNMNVSNPERTANLLGRLFGWRIRWQGPSAMGGRTVHVGTTDDYLALYCRAVEGDDPEFDGPGPGGLNHVGVLVDDLDGTETRVREAGLVPFNHADYEPGRRFYFEDPDGIEYEVVTYRAEKGRSPEARDD
jgi:catechol 2,3-dioxygenase-like lactoylglutathione lyase family enzyme